MEIEQSPSAQSETGVQPSHLLANLVLFGRTLRRFGAPVMPAQIADLAAALGYIDLARRQDVKNAARAVLISRRDDITLFDQLFDLFWRLWENPLSPALHPWQDARRKRSSSERPTLAGVDGQPPAADSQPEEETALTYSATEILRRKPFAQLSPDEWVAVQRLLLAFDWKLPMRRTRRKRPATHGPLFDWRRTLRGSLRYGGEPVRLARRTRLRKPRPIVTICDLSGSMERYSRVLLQWLYVLSHGLNQAETFVFSTRLTRVTPHLRRRPIDEALDEVAAQALDLGGGTQIGAALRAFNHVWARRVLGRGALVLVISDGWDRGDPAVVREQMQRLRLNSRRLIWLNPLLGSPDYEPLTRGMQAALPFIDHFLPIHNLNSLEQLAGLLTKIDQR